MIWETVLLAFRAIRRNTMRSILTILGVVIGVAAVITMVTIGTGATDKVVSDIGRLGSNLLIITPGQAQGANNAGSSAKPFTMTDTPAIKAQISGVDAASPVGSRKVTAILGSQNWTTTLTGTDNDYFTTRQWQFAAGRQFTDGELKAGSAVCIIGETVRHNLFGDASGLGDTIRLQKIPCLIIGVLVAKGQGSFGMDQDDVVLMPLRTYQHRIAGNTDVALIYVSGHEGLSTSVLKANLQALLRERRRITAGSTDDFNVMDMKEISNTVSGATSILTDLLGAVAGISLLVGGIGIMNIMLVSVTERTREIGIRLAVGALKNQVLAQFLVEAVVLSMLGGLVGIGLGIGLSAIAVHFLNVSLIISPGIIALAFLFSAAVGVVFGYFPARRAANLNPIEALRHE